MVLRVFFSFDYDRDIWRASQVHKCWVTTPERESAGYIDPASWESLKKQGEEAIKKWIDKQLENTTVTVVLIGYQTSKSKWVNYAIEHSFIGQNGIVAIYIHKLKDNFQKIDSKGENPLNKLQMNNMPLSKIYLTYDWIDDDGYNNLAKWIEAAARKAGG